MKNSLTSIILFFSFLVAISQSKPSETPLKKLDSIALQDVPEQAPGIATAIIQNGKVIYENYAGYAHLEDSLMIHETTRFNIASNGKQFTALAVLLLIDENKINLSDDIRKWYPQFYPSVDEAITIQNLLNHTSGIRDCYDLWALKGMTWWKQSFSNKDVEDLIAKQAHLNFSPGTKYLYSNTNYILLALIIEKVTDQSFPSYTDEMFELLGMPNTSFEANATEIDGPIAKPYFNFGSWTTFDWIWNVCGDGNLFTTMKDQIRWEQLVQGKAKSKIKPTLISKSQQSIEGSSFPNYGYGLELGTYKGMNYRFHEGATGAWKATVIRFPEKNTSLLTFTNSGKCVPYSQTRQLADAFFGLKSDQEHFSTKPEKVGEFVSKEDVLGTYLTDADFAFTFELKDEKLFLKRFGRNDVELEREADNIFRQKFDPDFKLEFLRNAKGEMQVTAYYVSHAPYSLTRTSPIQKNGDLKRHDGTYLNAETGVTIALSHLEGKNFEVTIGSNKTTGLLVSDAKMLVDFYTLELQKGLVFLNGERIKKVVFIKQTP